MSLTKVYDAATVYKCLNGIINVYKPAGMKTRYVKNAIVSNICSDLNEMKVREPRKLDKARLLESGGASDPIARKLAETDLADHVLATGPRYQAEDIRCGMVAGLGQHTSGVLLFGINDGLKKSSRIQRNRPIRAYHITGRLGVATENHLPDSRVTVRANYFHANPDRISALAASLQASHQRKMYEMCGVDMQSQAAYEIACKGLIRPVNNSQPVIYSIKLIDFQRPYFTLEVHAINESEQYLATLIHEMGIELRTVAHCSALRCIRHGHFDVTHSLLRHGWHLAGIVKNMREQRDVLNAHPYLLKQTRIELHNGSQQTAA